MTETRLNYLGPAPKALTDQTGRRPWWKAVPLPFLLVVVAPTLIAGAYIGLISSPMYVSEARFIVRAPSQSQPSSLGVALQGVGLSAGQTDAFAVHEYINSRDGIEELSRTQDLRAIFARPGSDMLSRFPRPWEGRSDEDLYKAFGRYVTVGYDSTTGISTLRVEAFRAGDAQKVSEALLQGGERLVNRLNERASADAVRDAVNAQANARGRLVQAQAALTNFRNQERYIDPARTAAESGQLIGGLLSTIANLRAERSQLASQAPQSPQLPQLDSRIAAYEGQVAAERAKIAGTTDSLAPKIGVYEDLVLARELADREVVQSSAALLTAEQEAARQKLYLDRVVNPGLPDKSTEPNRLVLFLTILLSLLGAYGVGWLVWAGIREHRQT